MTVKIKNAAALRQGIIDGLKAVGQYKLNVLEVIFYEDTDVVFTGGVAQALNYLENDVYWDAERNWANATRAVVRVM